MIGIVWFFPLKPPTINIQSYVLAKKVSVLKKCHKTEKIQKKSVCHGAMKIDKNLLSLLSLQNEFGYFFKKICYQREET